MKIFITSCGRYDLLKQTLRSFHKYQRFLNSGIIIHEDSGFIDVSKNQSSHPGCEFFAEIIFTNGIGQHASIEKFLNENTGKYAVMLEDDWTFQSDYDWIEESIQIMEADPKVIKVLARKDSPHPCVHDKAISRAVFRSWAENGDENTPNVNLFIHEATKRPENGLGSWDANIFGYIQPWENKGITWHGFSWNPGVTRIDLLKQFVPFPKWEQELGKNIYDAGYKVVELERGVYTHIGDGRSTHE